MKLKIFEAKTYLVTYLVTVLAVVTFSQFIYQLFGHTIPNIIWTFFKDAGVIIILAAVFLFAFAWILKARPQNRPKHYSIVIFDVYENESTIDGLRTEFKNHDVAWSFMKQYKKSYPLHNFALVTELPRSDKRTIFRYI